MFDLKSVTVRVNMKRYGKNTLISVVWNDTDIVGSVLSLADEAETNNEMASVHFAATNNTYFYL